MTRLLCACLALAASGFVWALPMDSRWQAAASLLFGLTFIAAVWDIACTAMERER